MKIYTNNPLISVIVPVYRIEKYISRCINSILNQTYKNLEIILVNDGSPDNCGIICEKYANKDKRIKVIHKENGGLSDARNEGLRTFQGIYVTFVDGDDWISKFYIENLYNAIRSSEADLAISNFENVKKNCKIKKSPINTLLNMQVVTVEDCFKKLLNQRGVETSAWGKMYRKNIIKDLQYPVGKLYEDIPVTTQAISRCSKIVIIDNIDYYYFQRNDSIQYEKFKIEKMDAIYHMKDLNQYIKVQYPNLCPDADSRYFCTLCNVFFQITSSEYKKEQNFIWSEILKIRKYVILNRHGRLKARIGAVTSYFGFNIMLFLYRHTQFRGRRHA